MSDIDSADDSQDPSLFIGRDIVTAYTNAHQAASICRFVEVVRPLLPPGLDLRIRTPIDLGQIIVPDPAVQIVLRRADHYRGSHPSLTDLVLVVEFINGFDDVDTDRLELYAEHQVPTVWTIDIDNRLLSIEDHLQNVSALQCSSDVVSIPGTKLLLPVASFIP